MYYKDLDPYIAFSGDIEEGVFNIGWLDVGYEFNQGNVSQKLKDKLLYLTLFQEISQKPRRKRKYLLSIHTNFVRGLPFGCPFCKKEIWLDKDNKPMVLGCHEIILPNMEKKYIQLSNHALSLHHRT